MRALRWTLPALTACALLLGAIPVASSAKGKCTRATNVEAIVDDSGSMAVTDPNRLRVQGLDLLINSLSPGTLMGAVEFGSSFDPSQPSADTVFPPGAVGPNAAAMRSALEQKIHADNGGTDYNAAFAQSDADNPNATARIFLTDGGHNVGSYNNGHLAHRVPTYVIGFSPGLASPSDRARLKQIASDTGGRYYALKDSSRLQSVINSIGAALTCQKPPTNFVDQLKKGQSKSHHVKVKRGTKRVQIALTWASPLDKFTVVGIKLVRHGKTLASAARVKRLKVTITRSSTFILVKVTRLRSGELKFKVKATKVGSPEPRVTLTTQVTQGRHK
jgi:hypothetical protein